MKAAVVLLGDDALVGRTGPNGRAERAGSKERERGPQGGCGPKFSNKDLSLKVKDSNAFKQNLN
jgi:hypothetical protein